MFSIGETGSASIRRLQVLNRILKANQNYPPCCFTRKTYTSEPINNKENDEKHTYVRIGDTINELKKVTSPEKVPRGYLSLYNGVMSDSQVFLKYLKWFMQKDSLKQDTFLIGSPPGAFRRNLAMSFAELTQREVEYLCLTSDTTEADIKQRREVLANSIRYANQCAVNAALNGRILIIEGIEKAERNLLPILNNLLENREINLDDGHFLVSPERYDKLMQVAKSTNKNLSDLNLIRVHEDFRVIAIGLPVPKYKGNSLDPPLRSRFQAHLVSLPSYQDFTKYLITANQRVNPELIKDICNFGYSFYTDEMQSLNLPDFPLENVDKLVRIMNSCRLSNDLNSNYGNNYLPMESLLNKLYPYKLLLKNEDTNNKYYFDLLQKFNLAKSTPSNKQINYKLNSIEDNASNQKTVQFMNLNNNLQLSIDLVKGTRQSANEKKNMSDRDFIMNDYQSSQLVEMMLNHASGHDFCLVGPQGSGKTELIKQFAKRLNYNMHTLYLYKDMSARELIQQRVTLTNGDTKWNNSILIEAAIRGDLLVLDGIHRIKDDTLMSIRRLIQDREIDLLDGRKLLSAERYDSLVNESKKNKLNIESNIVRIHPSFRIIATAEPPVGKASFKEKDDATKPSSNTPTTLNIQNKSSNNEWLNSEVLNLFLYQHVEPLDLNYEYEIISKKFKLNKKHEKLLDLMEQLKQSGQEENQLKHVSKHFSLRKLLQLSHKLEQYPTLSLREQIQNACLYKFMPQLNKEILNEFLARNKLNSEEVDETENKTLDEIEHMFRVEKQEQDINDLAKIPDTLFYENRLHTIILNNMLRDFQLDEHMLLIGNQGTGKNKLVDKFLMLTKRPREYIQLHRDTTVHSLTVQPVIKSGIVEYEDSPLVKAVKNGYVLVIDEADKAPLHVTCILKSLIESNEMVLSDGRRIVPEDSQEQGKDIIRMHKNFRMIILANRPGFPFLGNDFFAILGDLLSCHAVDNPDPLSEIEMLRKYAPNVSEKILAKLVSAFGSLRQLSDQGLISYPYSTRELVNIVKHLEKYPDDSLSTVLSNVHDFDHYADQSDLKNTFREVMNKHGIPIGSSSFQIHTAQLVPTPPLLKMHDLNVAKKPDDYLTYSYENIEWNKALSLKKDFITNYKCDPTECRVNSFSELKTKWSLGDKQQIISDFLVVNKNGKDIVYISGIKPLNVRRLDTSTNQVIELNISECFKSAWRMYFPRIKLFPCAEQDKVLVFEETTGELFKVDFDSNQVFKMDNATSNLLNKAKKRINKYFVDQRQLFKMTNLNEHIYLMSLNNSNRFSLLNMRDNISIDLKINDNLCINQLIQLNEKHVLIAAFDSNSSGENLKPSDLKYFILNFDSNQSALNNELSKVFSIYALDNNVLGFNDDLLLGQIQFKKSTNQSDDEKSDPIPQLFKDIIPESKQNSFEPFILPSIFTHFVTIPKFDADANQKLASFFCRRETPLVNKDINLNDLNNHNIKALTPILKSIVNMSTREVITQITRNSSPKQLDSSNLVANCLGYVELFDMNERKIRYLEVPKSSDSNGAWESYTHLNTTNESHFLIDLSPNKTGNLYTLDFYGNLLEWETGLMRLGRSLSEWQKLIMDKQDKELNIEIFKDSPNKELKDFKGPKHGKVDKNNAPHVGGNTWAGGSGGFDTAGLGGVGGPYRLDSGHQVFQISDDLKQNVPENVRKAAREMAEKAFRERLREIQMSPFEHDLYMQYLENVKKPIQQLRNILDGLEAKKKERQWLKNQIHGDLDDTKLVEALVGEKNVFKRRGEDPNSENSLNMEKPKRLRLVVDVSGSMYRFNGVDNRLERELEAVLMVMEAFKGFENKILYDIYGHSGDGYNLKFVDAHLTPKNEAERLKLLKTMMAHSQFCSAGDHTFEATRYAIEQIAKEEADDHFVIVLSDANFDRYGLSPRTFSKIMLDTNPNVNVFCIFIGTLGNQAISLKKSLPFGKAFVCMNTQEVPKIMQQIFQAAMLNN